METTSYLKKIRNKQLRSFMARSECSNHNLGLWKYRDSVENDQFCNFCQRQNIDVIEDKRLFCSCM